MLKSTNAGVNWSDVSRQSDGTCFADPGFGATLSDVATVKATDLVYVVTDSFGGRRFSADGFAGPTAVRNNTSVNCFDVPMKIAVDQDNPNRNFMVGKCAGSLAFGFSSDGGVTYDISLEYANGNGSNITSLYDVALAGGNAIAVGDGGVILTSPDGLKAYFQPADGSEATTGWRAVDKFDVNNAAVVGVGGKLVISTQAGTIPDLIAPAGTISGPVLSNRRPARDIHGERHRQRRRFGHRPGGLPVERDRRADASRQPGGDHVPERRLLHAEGDVQGPRRQRRRGDLSVGVQAAPASSGGSTVTRTVTVPGGSITLGAPRACVPAGGSFTATLSFKKSRKKGTKKVKVTKVEFYIDKKRVKTDTKAPFRQTLTVRNLAAGSKHTLKARATIKVKKGRSPKKSVSTTFSVSPAL